MKINKLYLVSIILNTLYGCMNEDIYLSDDINQVKYNQAFKDVFGAIDPNQDFNTAILCKAHISVDLGLGKEYDVKFYTANPRTNWENAYLLRKCKVKDGDTADIQLDIPEYMQKIYVACVTKDNERVVDEFEIKEGNIEVNFTAIGGIKSRASSTPGTRAAKGGDEIVKIIYGDPNLNTAPETLPLDWRDFIVIRGSGECDASIHGDFLKKDPITIEGKEYLGYKIVWNYPENWSQEGKGTDDDPYRYVKEAIYSPGTIYMDDLSNIWTLLRTGELHDKITYTGTNDYGTKSIYPFEAYTKRPDVFSKVLEVMGKESHPITEASNSNANFELLVKASKGSTTGIINLFPIYANKGFKDHIGIYYYKKNDGDNINQNIEPRKEITLFSTDPNDAEFNHIYQEFILWNACDDSGKTYYDNPDVLNSKDGWTDAPFDHLDLPSDGDNTISDSYERFTSLPTYNKVGVFSTNYAVVSQTDDEGNVTALESTNRSYYYTYRRWAPKRVRKMQLQVPDGYRIGFWIETIAGDEYSVSENEYDWGKDWGPQGQSDITGLDRKRYSNIELNENKQAYCAVINETVQYDINGDGEKEECYIIGLEDMALGTTYKSSWGGASQTSDNDCNDMVFLVEATNLYVVDTQTNDDKASVWTLAYEDMGGIGDFDFNDVVIQLKYSITDATVGQTYPTLDLRLMATGGTLPVWLFYKDPSKNNQYVCIGSTNTNGENGKYLANLPPTEEQLKELGAYELHHLINPKIEPAYNGDNRTYNMYNTYNLSIKDTDNALGKKLYPVKVSKNFSVSWEMKNFVLIVKRADGILSEISLPHRDTENKDKDVKAPQGFCCDADLKWVYEKTPIIDVYPEFRRWVNDGTYHVKGEIGWFNKVCETATNGNNQTADGAQAFPK